MTCKHGVNLSKLNCITCYPGTKNKCSCENQGKCELCKVFKPICNDINNLCKKMLKETSNEIPINKDIDDICEKMLKEMLNEVPIDIKKNI
jgi:hypothetical protein